MKKIITIVDLLEKVKKDFSETEIAEIKKAYDLVDNIYDGEMRLSGDTYVSHLVNVAYILAEMNSDLDTIISGLLHDVLEKEKLTANDIEEKFGSEILTLVEGITLINNLNFNGDKKSVIANNRKILVGLSEDVRVIFIKLADRLHNMRTLSATSEKAQKEKGKETLDILTPIAARLGMHTIKSELEDLSLRYLKPDMYFYIVEELNKTKNERNELVTKMKEKVSNILNENNLKHEIKGRAKSIYSIYKKLDKGKKFSNIYDLYALRVYVNKDNECYQTLGLIHGEFKHMSNRFKDYVAMPKPNMYQSLHTTVFGVDDKLFEIQIRTYEMDLIAEGGIAAHWNYKESGSNKKASIQDEMERKLQFFKSVMGIKENSTSKDELILSMEQELFSQNIYVFTPSGDAIELPNGSTPVDFAYRVHTNVGNHMIGAIVNGSIVTLDYVLKNNDIIKINTNKNSSGPNKEWINHAYTSSAKSKIKSFFNKIDKEEYLKRGEENLHKELRRKKLSINEFMSDNNIKKILKELKIDSVEELYINIGNSKYQPGSIINIINSPIEDKEEFIINRVQNKKTILNNTKADIIVRGISDIKVNIASCCKPVANDEVMGYITKGNGITIHRVNCPNISDLDDRLIDVSWNEKILKKYNSLLLVEAISGENTLLEIIAKTSNSNVNVDGIKTINKEDLVMYELSITVPNKEILNKFITDLEMISNVTRVTRVIK